MGKLKVHEIPPGCNYFSCSPFNNAHILCQISWSIVALGENLINASMSCMILKNKLKLKKKKKSVLKWSSSQLLGVGTEERWVGSWNLIMALQGKTNHMETVKFIMEKDQSRPFCSPSIIWIVQEWAVWSLDTKTPVSSPLFPGSILHNPTVGVLASQHLHLMVTSCQSSMQQPSYMQEVREGYLPFQGKGPAASQCIQGKLSRQGYHG